MLLAGWPVRRFLRSVAGTGGRGPGAPNVRDTCYKNMNRYRLDDFLEYALSKRGRENVALAALAASCVAGIVVIGRL